MSSPLLELHTVSKWFGRGRRLGVRDVSLHVGAGETVGLVGRSGAGKSTVARLVVGLHRPDKGSVRFEGVDLASLDRQAHRAVRQRVHLVFQDPYTSLARHLRVADLVAEPLAIHRVGGRAERRPRVAEALHAVGLAPGRFVARWPHELSGGERQRVALARALVLRPRLVVLDEPTAMLDPPVRFALLDLLADLQSSHGLAYLFVTHDLALADRFCDSLVVMADGTVVEHGPTARVVGQPVHAATLALVAAARRLQAAVPEGAR